jgi:hypothetical protein
VGIVYEDRGRFRSQAAVQVGTPVPVDPWVESYRTDPRGAVRAVTDEVARGLRAVTVNHDSWDDLRLIDRAATIALADDRSIERRYARRNELRRGLGAALHRAGGDDPEWTALAARVNAHEAELEALGLDVGRSLPTPTRLTRERRRLRVALVAVAPAAAVGTVANAPVAAVIKGVTVTVKAPAWQATAKGLAGFLLCPIVWGTEAYLVRRHGRRAVITVLVAAPLGGLAWIGWRERRARWRQVRAEEQLLATRADDVRAAATTRAAVRACIDELVAPRGAPDAAEPGARLARADQSVSASTT